MARFLIAIVAVPLVFIASLLAMLMIFETPAPAIPAVPSAIVFALILLSRDNLRAVGRAGLACVVAGLLTLAMRGGARADVGSLGDAALGMGAALVVLGLIAFAVARRMATR